MTSQQTPDALLRLPQVKAATGLSRSSVYALEAAGQFPTRIALGAKSVAWKSSEVQAWIESRQRKTAAP